MSSTPQTKEEARAFEEAKYPIKTETTIDSTFNPDLSSSHKKKVVTSYKDGEEIKAEYYELNLAPWNPANLIPFKSQEEIKDVVASYDDTYWLKGYKDDATKRAALKDINSQNVRQERDELLKKYDWTETADLTTDEKAAWKTYKNALRNLPKQSGFPYVEDGMVWPTKPD